MAQPKSKKSAKFTANTRFVEEAIEGFVNLVTDINAKRALRKMHAPVMAFLRQLDVLAETEDGRVTIGAIAKAFEDRVLENAKARKPKTKRSVKKRLPGVSAPTTKRRAKV